MSFMTYSLSVRQAQQACSINELHELLTRCTPSTAGLLHQWASWATHSVHTKHSRPAPSMSFMTYSLGAHQAQQACSINELHDLLTQCTPSTAGLLHQWAPWPTHSVRTKHSRPAPSMSIMSYSLSVRQAQQARINELHERLQDGQQTFACCCRAVVVGGIHAFAARSDEASKVKPWYLHAHIRYQLWQMKCFKQMKWCKQEWIKCHD